MGVDLVRPFGSGEKATLEGNAAIPYLMLRHIRAHAGELRPLRVQPFVGVPYLLTFGFKVSRPLPRVILRVSRLIEAVVRPLRSALGTRVVVVLEKPADNPAGTGADAPSSAWRPGRTSSSAFTAPGAS